MHLKNLAVAVLLFGIAACGRVAPLPVNTLTPETAQATVESLTPQVSTPATPTFPPSRLLSICLINEPRSLFLYDAVSTSEQSVLAAVYDGPIDVKSYTPSPVILEKLPALSDGDASLRAVQVNRGDMIVDVHGNLTNLDDGVSYRPAGCTKVACAQAYPGTGPVEMDQLVLLFKLLPGLLWSDGEPLTAADSVYSSEVARNLYPSASPGTVSRTASYTAVDDLAVEWVGIPGFVDGLYQTKFFSPLPQHAWSGIPLAELPTSEAASRKPLGWGAYVIDEWVTGDHISLHANPLYFRAGEGLPYFENLVYRFVSDSREAQAALLAGECDLVDQTAGLETETPFLLGLRDEGRIALVFQTAIAWDVLQFAVDPQAEDRPAFFATPEVRQAVALCIDRQALVDQLSGGQMQVADLYIHPLHPLFNTQARQYDFDPQAAAGLLTASGWLEDDSDPSTPRISQSVVGIPDSTAFTLQYLVSDGSESQAAAKMIQADLARCGIRAEILTTPVEEYLGAGPEGAVFGRQFDLAQFAWMAAVEPPCSLYLTSEIPGQYPAYPKGWGGVNAGGYSNVQYDQACLDALNSLADAPQHAASHAEAQEIFAGDLPALPLYWHYRVFAGRPDMCGLPPEPVTESILIDLELFNYGDGCP